MDGGDGEKKAKTKNGNAKKRKSSSAENESEIPPKRRLRSSDVKRLDEIGTEANRELPIFKLPDELLVDFIKLIPIAQWASLELVSRRFQAVVHGLWKQTREIRLDELKYKEEDKKKNYQVLIMALKKFLIRAPNITSISGFTEFCDRQRSIRRESILQLVKFQHLQTIDFTGEEMVSAKNFAVFLELSGSRQHLKSLNFIGIYGFSLENKKALKTALGGKEDQPILKLECLKFIAETVLYHEPSPLQIDWSMMKKLVITGTCDRVAESLLPIIRQCTQVTHLEVRLPSYETEDDDEDEGGGPSYGDLLQAIAALENLSVLKIGSSWRREPLLAALLELIRSLGRRGCIVDFALKNYCNEQIVDEITDHLPQLKSLDLGLEACTKPPLERLVKEMKQLETLKFRWCYYVDGAVIRALVGNLSGLQCLYLEYPDCNSKDFNGLAGLENLKDLRIKGIDIGNATVKAWGDLGFGSCLETLELSFQGAISSKVMGGFIKNLVHLRFMKLDGVTNRILKMIAVRCPVLVELDLSYSPSITSVGIQAVIDQCSLLKVLKVVGHYGWFPAALNVGKYRKIKFKSRYDE